MLDATEPAQWVKTAWELIDLHLPGQGWRFKWDFAKRRAGRCTYNDRVISLSYHYVSLNMDKPEDILDTILHEIAHAIAGYAAAHGPEWKAAAVRIGARPERCYDAEVIAMPQKALSATCNGCGKVYARHRNIKRGYSAYCPKCGTETGRLVFIRKES